MARLDADDVLDVVVDSVRAVLMVDEGDVAIAPGESTAAWRRVRFDEELHADSLDLVEVIERVEEALGRRGVAVHVPDEDIRGLRSIGDTVDRVLRLAGAGR